MSGGLRLSGQSKGLVQRDGFSSCTGLLLGGDIRIRLDGIPDSYILTDKHLGKQHVVDALDSLSGVLLL